MPIEFWFDFASSYSHVAALRIEEACARAGVALVYKPFLLGPLFTELLGIKDSPFNPQPVRGRYMWRDVERLCGKYGLPWKKPSVFPRNSVLAARAALGRANVDEARGLGLFGAPSFIVGDELFFGQDRLDDAVAWASR